MTPSSSRPALVQSGTRCNSAPSPSSRRPSAPADNPQGMRQIDHQTMVRYSRSKLGRNRDQRQPGCRRSLLLRLRKAATNHAVERLTHKHDDVPRTPRTAIASLAKPRPSRKGIFALRGKLALSRIELRRDAANRSRGVVHRLRRIADPMCSLAVRQPRPFHRNLGIATGLHLVETEEVDWEAWATVVGVR